MFKYVECYCEHIADTCCILLITHMILASCHKKDAKIYYQWIIFLFVYLPERLHLFRVGVWCHLIEFKPFESPLKVNPAYNRWWTLAGLAKYSWWHNPGLTFWVVVCLFSTSERRVHGLLNVHVRHIIKWISTRAKGQLAVTHVHVASLC